MLFEQLAGNLVQGLVLGAVYGMATMGLSLIFGVLQVVNVGHGAFIMVGAFTSLMMFQAMGVPPIFAIPVAFIIGMALGMLFYYGAVKPLVSPSGSGIKKLTPQRMGMAAGMFIGLIVLMWINSRFFDLNIAIYLFVGIIFIYGFALYIYGGRRQDKAAELATLLVTFSFGSFISLAHNMRAARILAISMK